jgi:hypothetical protein
VRYTLWINQPTGKDHLPRAVSGFQTYPLCTARITVSEWCVVTLYT